MFSKNANSIFQNVISTYHVVNEIDQPHTNPYKEGSLDFLVYEKCWIDTVQWHLEDVIRDPNIDPVSALKIKRRIDASNQDRTDMVEFVDSYFLDKYKAIAKKQGATLNTESPAWAIDRLSILALKVYHMAEEANRENASDEHRTNCNKKLNVLLDQRVDLSMAIDQLIADIESGNKYMKVYKQMKMYNDPSLNPVLYNKE